MAVNGSNCENFVIIIGLGLYKKGERTWNQIILIYKIGLSLNQIYF